MKLNQRTAAAAVALVAAGGFARPAMALQNWFGYGGVFGPQTQYTFYAPPPINSGFEPSPVVSYSVPTTYVAPEVVTTYSGPNLVLPAVAYAPVTTYVPPVSCNSMGCGVATCGPTTFAPAPAPLAVPVPSATILQPAPSTIGTPIYPSPGVYPAAPPVTYPPIRTPEMPTSSTTVPADVPPTLSGFAPLGTGQTAPLNVTPPTSPATTTTTTSPTAKDAATKDAASQAPTIDRLKPNLDISVPEDAEDSLVPVKPFNSKANPDTEKTDADKTDTDAETGPRLGPEEGNTASKANPRPQLLAPATWRAARPATRRPAAKTTDSAWRPATQGK